jgi:CheY-specific phosphatase CheX
LSSQNQGLAKILVVISNVDLRLATTQFFSKRNWAETQNVLGFDLARTILQDEKFDLIVTDAGSGSDSIQDFVKWVRSTRRNASSLVLYMIPKGTSFKDELLQQDRLVLTWEGLLTEKQDEEFHREIESARSRTLSAHPAASHATPAAQKTFDARLLNAVLDATRDVVSFYFIGDSIEFGKPNYRKGPLTERSGITGLISIEGEKFKGSMALAASLDFLQLLSNKIYPDQDIKLTKEGSMDLIAELSNQLVGKIKMRFGDLGLSSQIGLPEVMIGKNHVVPHKVKDPALFLGLKVNGSICEIELSLSQEAGFSIDESKAVESSKGILMFD